MEKELTSIQWLNYYKEKLKDSNKTIRPNGFEIITKELQVLEAIKRHAVIQDNKLTIDFDGIMNTSWNQEKGMVKDYDLQAIDDYSLIQNFMRGE